MSEIYLNNEREESSHKSYSDEFFLDSSQKVESGLKFSFRIVGFDVSGDNGNVEALLADLMDISHHEDEDV